MDFLRLACWYGALVIIHFGINVSLGCSIGCEHCDDETCIQCASNYYLKEETCVQCPEYCTACDSYGYCSSSSCVLGYFSTDGACTKCPAHCESCTSSSFCKRCVTGYNGITCENGCGKGFFYGSSGCTKCQSNCLSCSAYQQCKTCVTGKWGLTCQNICFDHDDPHCSCSITTGQCDNSCLDGYFWESNYCNECSVGCSQCTSPDLCTSCSSGYVISGKTCMPCSTGNICTSCTTGNYISENVCKPCPVECETCSSPNVCTSCNTGYTLSETTCSPQCPDVCVTCSSPNVCESCRTDYIFSSTTCSPQCPAVCATCSFPNVCTSCITDYILSGTTCSPQCPAVCETCSFPNVCTSCITDYILSGTTCSPQCPDVCATCSSPNVCTSCITGYILSGTTCSPQCPDVCATCSSPNLCTSCITGYILSGTTCSPQCPAVCETCSFPNVCTSCITDYILSGTTCSPQCPDVCATCSSPNVCTSCITGYILSGTTCSPQCPDVCATCSSPNLCTSCITGYILSDTTCSQQCPTVCETCSSPNVCASCIIGYNLSGTACSPHCTTGYVLSETENKCIQCPLRCDNCLPSSQCITCSDGYYKSGNACTANSGNKSSQSNQPSEDAINTAVLGGAAGGGVFLLIIAGLIVVCIVMRRRKKSPPKTTDEESSTANIDTMNSTYKNDADTGYIYAMPNKVKHDKDIQLTTLPIQNSKHEAPPLNRHSVLEEADGDLEDLDDDEGDVAIPVKANISADNVYYTNVAGLKRSRIQIDKLQDYVDMKTKEDFLNEFRRLPQGLSRPCNDALTPLNRAKNRYKSVYPYDVSRVKLTGRGSDYINANYIDGYNEPNAYIASQGPADAQMKDFVDFWRMVWQERVEKIVMLTNLFEDGKMKCEQYWPDTGASHTYGDVMVTCLCEDIHAEHTVKDLTVSKGLEKRSLHHIHFTAWPDKGVPDDVTSLIEFRQKVLNTRAELGGPALVHCSAGVGRTGTYISLDVLTKEGYAEQSVDIFGCVTGLRSQRVAMVQTDEQYEYLHNSVVHALTFDCQPIPGDMFQQYMSKNTVKLDVQFEHIGSTGEKKITEETDAIQRNKKLHDKNRKHADVPGDRHRPRLHLQRKPGLSDYINATYLNSYTTKKRYIVAQTPLRGTLADFLCLVIQEPCSCIISMDDETMIDNTVGRYLPAANQNLKHGNFEIHCVSCESKPDHTVRILKIKHQGSRGPDEKNVFHFQYSAWKKNIPVPNDSSSFLNLITDVNKTSTESEIGEPIMVHCLNGAERSGLFCAVSVLIQKMDIEHEVSVVNTVRQIKSRRGGAIPNKEQYIFCHECVCDYIQSFGVYANDFAVARATSGCEC